MTNAMPFRKMNGLGNDFVVLDLRAHALDLGPGEVRAIADRDHGIGCDQVIGIEPSAGADAFIRFGTPRRRGRRLRQCGALRRGVARGRAGTSRSLETETRSSRSSPRAAPSPSTWDARARLGRDPARGADPGYQRVECSRASRSGVAFASVVNVGNPHCMFFVEVSTRRFPGRADDRESSAVPGARQRWLAEVTGPTVCACGLGSEARSTRRPAARRHAPRRWPRLGAG